MRCTRPRSSKAPAIPRFRPPGRSAQAPQSRIPPSARTPSSILPDPALLPCPTQSADTPRPPAPGRFRTQPQAPSQFDSPAQPQVRLLAPHAITTPMTSPAHSAPPQLVDLGSHQSHVAAGRHASAVVSTGATLVPPERTAAAGPSAHSPQTPRSPPWGGYAPSGTPATGTTASKRKPRPETIPHPQPVPSSAESDNFSSPSASTAARPARATRSRRPPHRNPQSRHPKHHQPRLGTGCHRAPHSTRCPRRPAGSRCVSLDRPASGCPPR